MGILGSIGKPSQKEKDKAFYKKRDKTLNKAIAAGKVTGKQLTALRTVRAQKDVKAKKAVKKKSFIKRAGAYLAPGLAKKTEEKNKLIKEVTGGGK